MKGKEFFKGDGSVPWYVTSVSIFATMLSPISFLGLAGSSYAGSWILWFAQLGMVVAIPLTIRFILPIFARIDIDTDMITWINVLILKHFVLFQHSCLLFINWDVCLSLCTSHQLVYQY